MTPLRLTDSQLRGKERHADLCSKLSFEQP
jgi:hypothetical protein